MRKKYYLFISVIFFVCTLFNCAAWQESYRQNYRNNYCTYDGAYALGVNDARNERPMKTKPGELCDESAREEVAKGYRKGYTQGLKTQKSIKVKHDVRY